jgi:hypothetical protein
MRKKSMTDTTPTPPEITDTTPTPPKKKTLASLEINDVVDSWCGKCGDFTPHKVKTLQPPKPPKSACTTCKAIHQVRYQKPGSKKSTPNAKSDLPPWSELIEGASPEHATQYTITGNFEEGDLIMHKTFGLGCVVTVSGRHRAQMSFESGVKSMIQNYGL